jgi:calcineurin-like phosphoesterase family protein
MKVFAIADLHLGHDNLALHRGFNSCQQHDNLIISNWNKTVSKKDTVYILGDITMEKDLYEFYLSKLNGIKNVILGNHDLPQHIHSLLKYVNKIAGMFDYKGGTLTHCPIHPMELENNKFRFNIHGHIHEEKIENDKYICVSCEHVNYTPILIETLIK